MQSRLCVFVCFVLLTGEAVAQTTSAYVATTAPATTAAATTAYVATTAPATTAPATTAAATTAYVATTAPATTAPATTAYVATTAPATTAPGTTAYVATTAAPATTASATTASATTAPATSAYVATTAPATSSAYVATTAPAASSAYVATTAPDTASATTDAYATVQPTPSEPEHCDDFFSICAIPIGSCSQHEHCGPWLGSMQTGDIPSCGLDHFVDECWTALSFPESSPGLRLAYDVGTCYLCCGESAEDSDEYSCIDAHTTDDAHCEIPFFYNDEYHMDCVTIDSVPYCPLETDIIAPQTREDLVECVDPNAAHSPTTQHEETDAPVATTSNAVRASLSLFVIVTVSIFATAL